MLVTRIFGFVQNVMEGGTGISSFDKKCRICCPTLEYGTLNNCGLRAYRRYGKLDYPTGERLGVRVPLEKCAAGKTVSFFTRRGQYRRFRAGFAV
jgi:hypothetical protein